MRIHDHIRTPSIPLTEWHILLWDYEPHHALLSMSTRKLVPKFWDTGLPGHDLYQVGLLRCGGQDHTVHVGGVRALVEVGFGLVLEVGQVQGGEEALGLLGVLGGQHRGVFVDVDVAGVQFFTHAGDAGVVKGMKLLKLLLPLLLLNLGRWRNYILCPIPIPPNLPRIPSHIHRPGIPPIQARPIQYDRILDVIPRIRHDSH